jgi:CHAT domain-containing protein
MADAQKGKTKGRARGGGKRGAAGRPPATGGGKAAAPRRAAAEPAAAAAAGEVPEPHNEFELDDEAVEIALQTGEHAGLLEDYFGADHYAELRQLAREAAARGVRGGPRVLILPGIMGSKIGKRGKIFDDVYWFDPLDVAKGNLDRLALGPKEPGFVALGVILLGYLKLKLRLKAVGYDAAFHAFDWRQSVAEAGAELVARLAKEGGENVSLVAHSMGGLVARWALGNGGKCRRLVMLGTPNYGSFAPVMALRGTYPVVRKVGSLDQKHTAEWLAENVFASFPGLAQMFPSPERFKEVDLYDLAVWPADDLRPRKAILDGVKAVQQALAPGGEGTFLVAGVNRDTVTGLKVEDGAFVYESTREGDGTVPLSFCLLPGTEATYFVEESHGSLPNNKLVAQAVAQILDRGRTDLLPTTPPAPERAAPRRTSEEKLRIDPYEGHRGGRLSQRELRSLLAELVSAEAREDLPAPRPEAAPAGVAAAQTGYRHEFQRVVVGRRRQHRIDLRFALGSITEVDSRALALGIFRDVAPTGAARALDKRLEGAITEMSRRRMFSGNVGEIFMLPTGRHDLRADFIAFAGLGSFDRFSAEVLQTAAENLLRTFVNTRVEEFATVLFGGGSGGDVAEALRNLLTGFFRGLLDADRDHSFRRLIICEYDRERYTALKEEIYRLSSTPLCQDVEITFDEQTLPDAREMLAARGTARRATVGTDPTYLIVRQEGRSEDGKAFDVRSSALTAGAKATVVTGVRSVETAEFDRLRREVDEVADADFSAVGQELGGLFLAEEVRAVLPRQRDRHLVVVHDAPLSRVPWETIALTDEGAAEERRVWLPAGEQGLSHRYAADNLSVAKWLEERIEDEELTVLLVVNPTGDLPGAEREGDRVKKLFENLPGCRLTELSEAEATRPALLSAFGSGRYDVIHYAGHAFFDEETPERSGILCHNRLALTGADLASLGNLPTLVFFNACESGRVRDGRAARKPDLAKRIVQSVGLAEAFMRGGIANFMGTYWPVGDAEAAGFAETFYQKILLGSSIGEALQAGRARVRDELNSKDWANYILYGNPDFVLKEGANGDG